MGIGRAIFETPTDSVAKELIRSSFGWHIIKVHSRRQIMSHPPTDTDASLVRNSYLRLLSEDNLSRWLREQRKKAKVEFSIDIES